MSSRLAPGRRACVLAIAAALLGLPGLALASHPSSPVALVQQNSNGTGLVDAGTSEGREIMLTASSASSTCNWSPYHLQFEVRPVTQAFTGVPTHFSVPLIKSSCVEQQYPFTRITGLAEGVTYKWQVRDYNVNNFSSAWVQYNGGAAAFTTSALPPNRMAFVTSSLTTAAGSCAGPSTVQLQNSSGTPVTVGSATPVPVFTVSDGGTSVAFYSDATCDAGTTAATMPAGSSLASFYWRTTRASGVTVGADMTGALWALQNHTVNPGPAAALTFVDGNSSAYVEACSSVRTIQVRDAYGNTVPAASNTSVALTADNATTAFYSDSACTIPITQVTIPAGSSQANFYFKDRVLGGRYLYATATGLPVASQYAYAYGNMQVVSTAQTVDAGQCSGLTTVQSQNGSFQPYAAPVGTVMYLYGSTGLSFYREGTCDAGISSVTMDGGTSNVSFYWRSTNASPPYSPTGSTVYLYGSANWFSAYSQNQTVNPGPAFRLGFGSNPQTVVAGACSGAAVARALDVYGNYSPHTSNLTISLSTSSTGGRFYSDASCLTQITSVTIPAGSLTANFYWRDTTPGSPTLTMSNAAPGLVTATQVQTVIPKLAFTSAAQNLEAGQCSAATTVQSQDGNNLGWNATAATNIVLSTTSPAGPFYADATCTTQISTITMAAGTNTVTFYWKDTRAGSPTLSATATGYAAASQGQTIRAGPPAVMAFTTAPQTVGAGSCSAITTVRQEDNYGNAATQGTARTVSLLSSAPSTTFYSDSTCATQITSTNIAASASTASFYWRDTAAPTTPILTARSAPLTDGTQQQTVSVGSATRVGITSAAKTVGAGACSGAATVGSQDASGNPSNLLAPVAVTLASSTGTTVFYAGGLCGGAPVTSVTIPAGTSSATFSWTETEAGTLTITPSATGFTGTGQDQTVTGGAGTRLSFTTAAQSVNAGSCSAATTVAVTDTYGNASPVGAAIAVGLTSTSATLAFYSDASCTISVSSMPIAAGSSSVTFYWRDLFTGTPTITASSAPLIAASQVENIGGRDQTKFRWYSAAGAPLGAENATIQAAPGTQLHLRIGVSTIAFTWKLLSGDADPTSETRANVEVVTGSYLNLSTADGSVETLAEGRVGQGQNRYQTLGDPGSAGWPFHAYNMGTVPAGKPTYPLCLTARTTGEALQVGYTFTATPNLSPTFPAGWQIASTALTETCFDLKAQGFNGGPLTVYLRDAVRGAGTDSVTDTFTLDRVVVKGDPPTFLALERSSTPDFASPTQVLTAELWDDPAFTNGAVLTPVLSGTTVPEVRVESRPNLPDSQNDIDPGGQGEWDFTLTFPSGGGTHYYRMVLTNSLGTKLSALESTTVPARADTAATQLAYTTAPLTVAAGACSGPLRVQAQDPGGNPRAQPSARTVTLTSSAPTGQFFADPACTSVTTAATIAAGASDATFYWRDTAAGSPVLTAASAGLTSATQTETVNPGPPSAVAFTTAPQNVTVGACSAAAVVQVRDAYGNASPVLANTTGPLSSTAGTTRFYANATCTTQITSLTVLAGQSTASFYFSDTAAGSPTISYAPSGLGTASQVETFSVGLPTRLAITSGALTLTAGQCSSAQLPGGTVVQAQDSFGNPANVTSNITVGLASTSGTLRFYSDSACTVAVTSRIITAPANTTTLYFRDTATGGPSITGTAAGLTPASQAETIIPAAPAALAFTSAPQSVVAGACSAAAQVRTQDTYGNISPAPSATTLPLSSSDAPVMRFYADAACTVPISSATVAAGTSSAQFFFRDTLAGSPVVTVSGPGLTSTTQTETIRPGPTQGLAMAGFPASSTAGVAGTFTLTAVDPYGNTAQDYAGSVQFSSTDPRATLPPVTSFSPGTGQRTFSATFATAGTQTLSASDNGVPPLSASQAGISVAAAAAATLQLTGLTPPMTVGVAQDVTITASDPFGNRATGYLGTVSFTSSDGAATLPSSYAFRAGDQGQRTFTGGATLRTPGTHSISVGDTVNAGLGGQLAGIVVLQAQGGGCAGDGECATGFCVGSVCCNTACNSACNACNLAGSVGTCSVVADGTACANGLYCDGAETCQGGTCSAGAPVSCVDPTGHDQLTCDEASTSCVVVPNSPPVIRRDASASGAPGIPYAYNGFGRVTALGARPMTFSSCAPLSGFMVDRSTGAVSWTPTATGTYSACVSAQNAHGQDQYSFQVNVVTPSGGPPVAAFTISPDTGDAPLTPALDGSGSTGDALPLQWRWDYGDFSPLGSGQQVATRYVLPGGYQAELTAFDAVGRSGTAKQPLWVTDQGRRPPTARIVGGALRGDGTLAANFSCDCQAGDSPLRGYLWELGDLATSTAATASASFPAGRYRVRLTVLDGNGLTATDSVEVVVTQGEQQPPHCRVGLSPPAGRSPLTVQHRATFGDDDGTVVSSAFTFSDGATSAEAEPQRTYASPGRYRAVLKVTDEQGLTCVDIVQVAAIGTSGVPPPGFVSAPTLTASCGLPYRYSEAGPLVSGQGPFQFELAPVGGGTLPEGMAVDAATGAISWTPSSRNAGMNRLVLRVSSPAGVTEQPLDINVSCPNPPDLVLGCTCSQAGGASWVALGAALALFARLQRRRRARVERSA